MVCYLPNKTRKFVIFFFVCFVFHLNIESSKKNNILSNLENAMNIQRYMKNMHLFDRDIKPGKPEAKSAAQTSV